MHQWFALTLASTAVLALCSPLMAQDKDAGAQAYKSTVRSTVWIHSDRGGGKLATGSGSLVDKEARLVLTNFHSCPAIAATAAPRAGPSSLASRSTLRLSTLANISTIASLFANPPDTVIRVIACPADSCSFTARAIR